MGDGNESCNTEQDLKKLELKINWHVILVITKITPMKIFMIMKTMIQVLIGEEQSHLHPPDRLSTYLPLTFPSLHPSFLAPSFHPLTPSLLINLPAYLHDWLSVCLSPCFTLLRHTKQSTNITSPYLVCTKKEIWDSTYCRTWEKLHFNLMRFSWIHFNFVCFDTI